jgi:hypothetical protein
VCTLLVDLQPSDVKDPLAQFQATRTTKEDVRQLVKNLNKALGEHSMDDALLNKAFEMWWPSWRRRLRISRQKRQTLPPRKTDRELLEELVDLARATMANHDAQEQIAYLSDQLSVMHARVNETQDQLQRENRRRLIELRKKFREARPPKPPKEIDNSKN